MHDKEVVVVDEPEAGVAVDDVADLLYELAIELQPQDAPITPSVRAARDRADVALLEKFRVDIRRDGIILGSAVAARERGDDDAWTLHGGVERASRRSGVGRLLVEAASRHATPLAFTTTTDGAAAFADAIGAETTGVDELLALHVADAELPPSDASDAFLEEWGSPTPAALLEDVAAAMANVYGPIDVARLRAQEERTQRWGLEEFALAWRDPQSRAVLAYTDVCFDPLVPSIARIGSTSCRGDARRRGLARSLKVATVQRVRQRWPKVTEIRTVNAAGNEPILRLNESLGFRRVGRAIHWLYE